MKLEQNELFATLDRYFFRKYTYKPGSHIHIRLEEIEKMKSAYPHGLTIPISHGQKVKGRWLKKLIVAIERLEESELKGEGCEKEY